ncbi:DUF1232 domain-containing protein [Iocasia frigidifontis]|uniref:DUF1232 domain-containing protein n=1 Tax=Iocasia fonsfrigidae TaxID=2682810 RepID=A0A8A7KHJ9_9FIRM|nr:YkvA family protein [Iocasia fonsfrigidae]QTL99555.1 DUF1232 domain-containing protein [Iocasia fonsfrigidae]
MGKSLFGLIKIIRYLSDSKVGFSKKFLFLLPFIYFLSPIDLFSEIYLPFVGYLDDLAVFVLMWPILKTLLGNYEGDKKHSKDREAVDIDQDDYTVE